MADPDPDVERQTKYAGKYNKRKQKFGGDVHDDTFLG
jgi:hypothetical protein